MLSDVDCDYGRRATLDESTSRELVILCNGCSYSDSIFDKWKGLSTLTRCEIPYH